MHDVVVVGGGIAGLAAGWRLRHWDTVLLESDARVGGRIRSERRGPYWLNWGAHVLAGPGSSTDALLNEVGVSAVAVPGTLTSLAMNGKFLGSGRIEVGPLGEAWQITLELVELVGCCRLDGLAGGIGAGTEARKVAKPFAGRVDVGVGLGHRASLSSRRGSPGGSVCANLVSDAGQHLRPLEPHG